MEPPSEQEKAGWENPWPDDGEQCPECHHGMLEVQSFGNHESPGYEVHAFCTGLNGTREEDADDSDGDACGCGWSGIYHPNKPTNESPSQTDRPSD